MNGLKRLVVNAYYRIKYAGKNVSPDRTATVKDLNTVFEGENKIGQYSSFNGSLGYGSYIGRNSNIHATVGRYCCISDRVNTISGTHPSGGFVSVHPAFYSAHRQGGVSYVREDSFDALPVNPVDRKTPVYIGSDVWIGCDVTILGGVCIGDGAIIAAGAVVTKDVEPYTVVGGVPAKEIKKRFTDDQIRFLTDFKWWERDREWIRNNADSFRNIDIFIEKNRK